MNGQKIMNISQRCVKDTFPIVSYYVLFGALMSSQGTILYKFYMPSPWTLDQDCHHLYSRDLLRGHQGWIFLTGSNLTGETEAHLNC